MRNIKAAIIIFILVLPLHAFAADSYSSTLKNQTQQYDPEGKGYILEQVDSWGKNCILNKGKQSLNPGETTVLEIQKNCEWAGIRYKMTKNGQTVGMVGHSFRDKNFSVEISLPCQGDSCIVTGLPPIEQSAKK